MKSLFLDTRILDKAARERYFLSEELMMENAAVALERAVLEQIASRAGKNETQSVVILCGIGNNGADGYALARRLSALRVTRCTDGSDTANGERVFRTIMPVVISVSAPKSELCTIQAERAAKCGVDCVPLDSEQSSMKDETSLSGEVERLLSCADIIVDCVFGSGFHGDLDGKTRQLCEKANAAEAIRISCDVPTGVREDGSVSEGAFCAACTVTMGALKLSLYNDAAKDYAGKITCEDLGVSRRLFESAASGGEQADGKGKPAAQLLEESDMTLPYRKNQLVNKGSFGHAAVASGEKIGASCIAGEAALHFGAGLVSLVRLGMEFEKSELPQVTPELMTASDFPPNTTAVAFGMGLGRSKGVAKPYFDWLCAHTDIPCVVDADVCFAPDLPDFLRAKGDGIVLTPHPKEFQAVLKNCGAGNYTIQECVIERPRLIEQFCRAFPKTVLLVKGANPMIGHFDGSQFQLYVNPLGTNALAKAGSGDVLAGLICALLSQGRDALDAAINGSLAHALASRQFKNNYSLTPLSLIEAVARL